MAKIYVGLSGGVDSAVSAALLKRAGHDVTGVFIKVWQPDWMECNWKEERLDAMRVAAHLDIPFETLDLEAEYKRDVIDYMICEYQAGRTPNPDVMCNRHVKFGAFKKWALDKGADAIATGHYARTKKVAEGENLLVGVDTNKDQSYFLWTLNQDDLKHVYFPVGDLTKPEVRKLAAKFHLPNSDKKDSQGLCFVGKVNIKEFLAHYIKTEKGNVLDTDGKVIGTHPGSLFFTIGERHGFTLIKKTPSDKAMYVVSKDSNANTLTVSHNQPFANSQNSNQCTLDQVNWVGKKCLEAAMRSSHPGALKARARYRAPLQDIELKISNDKVMVLFKGDDKSQILAPGQSVVIYQGEICLGGGIIA